MINNIFVFIYSVVFLFNHSFARDWCSGNTFESLLEFLLEEKNKVTALQIHGISLTVKFDS